MRNLLLLISICLCSFITAQRSHTVQPKETVYGITKKYNVTQSQLFKANPKLEAEGIHPGDVLNIPAVANTANVTEPAGQSLTKDEKGNTVYKVSPKETLYSISKKVNLSIDQLKALNPSLEEGLKAGQHLIVKAGEVRTTQAAQLVNYEPKVIAAREFNDSKPHTMGRNETLLEVMLQYGITYQEFINANPGIRNTFFKEGLVVQIPVASGYDYASLPKFNDEKINLLLLLPFQLEAASSRTRRVSVDFLSGAQMALKTLMNNGKNINLKVIDTNKDQENLMNKLAEVDWDTTDAVIGPLYGELVKELAEALKEKPVDIFSPFNSDKELEEYANLFLASPRDEFLVDEIVKEIGERYAGEEVIIFTETDEMVLAEYAKSKILSTIPNSVVRITTDSEALVQPSETIAEQLEDGSSFDQTYYTPIITVLVSGDKKVGQSYLDKILAMNADNLKAFGVKFIPQYDASIRRNQSTLAKLLNIGFAYSTDRLANVFGSKEKAIIKKFQNLYCKPPNKYQQVGYDLFMDVVDRMDQSGNLHDEILAAQSRFSTKFDYEKIAPTKAHVNKGIRMVRLYKKTEVTEEIPN